MADVLTPIQTNFLLSLPPTTRRRRRPDLELVTMASPGPDDSKQAASLLDWLRHLSSCEREETFSEENPWLVIILKQMLLLKTVKGDSVYSLDRNLDRDMFDCRLGNNFISKKRNVSEITVKLKAEWGLEEQLRVWSVGDDWDTVALSSLMVADLDGLLEVFADISRGQSFTVPCRMTWSPGAKVWIRESPVWLSTSSNSLAEYAAAALERAVWFKFWAAKKINPRRHGENQPFSHELPQKESYPMYKEGYADFWRELDRGKRLEIIGNPIDFADEYLTGFKSIESWRKSSPQSESLLDSDCAFVSLTEDEIRQQQVLVRKIKYFENPKSVESIASIGSSMDTSAGEFVDLLFTAGLDRISTVYDIVAKHIGSRLKDAYQQKMAETLVLLEEAEQVKKQGKKNREEIKTKDKLKAVKPKYKKQRRLSDASAVSVSTTASAATSLSSHEEDEGSYVRGVATRLVEEAIQSVHNPGASDSKHQIPELPDEDCIDDKDEHFPIDWPIRPLPSKSKKKKKKSKKRNKKLLPQTSVSSVSSVPDSSSESRNPDYLTKDILKFRRKMEKELETQRRAREEIIEEISDLCGRLFVGSHVEVFGSMSTGLALPSSDVDLAIVSAGVYYREEVCAAVRILGSELTTLPWVSNLQVIDSAAIPIVKVDCFCRDFALRVDCSFDDERHTGMHSSLFCTEAMREYPSLCDLALVLKKVILETGYNRAFLGGLSSYHLLLWLVAFLHSVSDSREAASGKLLLDFLRFFGYEFDPQRMGISASYDTCASFFTLQTPPFAPVVTLDPVCPDFNATRNCTLVSQILQVFAKAYSVLSDMLVQKQNKGFIKKLLKALVEC